MKADPKLTKDGSCANCGKHHRPRKPGGYHQDLARQDPFHSTECCRAWHGQPNPSEQALKRKHGGQSKGPKPGGNGFQHGRPDPYRMCACDLCIAAQKEAAAH